MIVRCSSCCHRARPDSRGGRCSHYEAGGWCRRRRRRRLGHSHLWSSSWLPSPPSSSSSMAGSDAVQGGRYRPAPPGSGGGRYFIYRPPRVPERRPFLNQRSRFSRRYRFERAIKSRLALPRLSAQITKASASLPERDARGQRRALAGLKVAPPPTSTRWRDDRRKSAAGTHTRRSAMHADLGARWCRRRSEL